MSLSLKREGGNDYAREILLLFDALGFGLVAWGV